MKSRLDSIGGTHVYTVFRGKDTFSCAVTYTHSCISTDVVYNYIRLLYSTYCPLIQFPIPKPGKNFPVLPSVIAQFEFACAQPSFAIETL